jgi:hypothetical protein
VNVLNPNQSATVFTLLERNTSKHDVARITGIAHSKDLGGVPTIKWWNNLPLGPTSKSVVQRVGQFSYAAFIHSPLWNLQKSRKGDRSSPT